MRPARIFDTELAGRLLGYPRVGLGAIVEEVLGLSLEKGHSAADWSTRPLPEPWLRYAALDVEVLVELRDALAAQLAEEGKRAWAEEEFAAIVAAAPAAPRVDPWRRTSGLHRVRKRRQLAVVRALWERRDEVAREADLSPRRVLADQAIIDAARAEAAKPPPTGRPQLDRISAFHARNARKHSARWQAAVLRARELDESELPEVAGATVTAGPPPAHRWAERVTRPRPPGSPPPGRRSARSRPRTGCRSRTCSPRTRCAAGLGTAGPGDPGDDRGRAGNAR